MAQKKHYQQKLKGSRLIVEKMREMAKRSHVEIGEAEWDGGTLSAKREDYHTLKVSTDDSSIQTIFYDEELADFPYDSGDTIQKIRNMVRGLRV